MSDIPRLDEEALAELQDVMEDEFGVLIETYLADSRTRIVGLNEAFEAGDADRLRKAAHSLKGSCINIGVPRLGSLCFELETLGDIGQLEDAEPVLAAIAQEFQEVSRQLENFSQEK
ncbi:Hpt domain-containing protein [Marinobacter sp.]|uniref:Hpt domain-containing protein n=1 Tax=Marinobacter sp. TaxID=50741 RepID=UPI002B27955A|nr:Hpt domain-containing protein [Marinobacter sp.]